MSNLAATGAAAAAGANDSNNMTVALVASHSTSQREKKTGREDCKQQQIMTIHNAVSFFF